MTIGDLVQHDGSPSGKALAGRPIDGAYQPGTEQGGGLGSGGTYLYRFFPVMISLSHDGGLFTPDRSKALSASLGTQIITAPPKNRVFTPTTGDRAGQRTICSGCNQVNQSRH